MSRPAKNKLLLSVMALTIIGGGFAVSQFSSQGASAQTAGGEMPAMPVPVVTIEEKPVQIWKDFSGRLTAVDYVEIRPQVSGIIQKIYFQDGQIVKEGDVLYKIDPTPYEAAVAQARADVAGAKEDADFAQKELQRAEELLKTGAISKQGYDQRVTSQKVNKSTSAGANARLKAALVDLDHATIQSPISGRISRSEITEGNLVNATNAPLLTTIVSDATIYADFDVDEKTYLNFVRNKAGQDLASEMAIPVRLSLNSDTGNFYEGTIKSFDNKINPSTGTIRVRAIFANEDNSLLPGMFANIQIGSAGTEKFKTVPEKAVLTDQSRKFVYIVADDAATYREVKLGDSIDSQRVVLSGLETGDKVIIENLMKIRPGAKVHAMTPQELDAMKAQAAQPPQTQKAEAANTDDKKADSAADKPAQEIPFDDPAEPTKEGTAPTPKEQTPAQE